MKSKRITMVRVKNVIITAFVAVWLFNGHYHHDGVGGMVAAATLEGGEEEADTTTRGTMMTTVVDGVPVPERKLSKKSKASKPDANDDNMLQQLWRALVFDKAMNVYRWMQLQQSVSEVTPRTGKKNDGDGRELFDSLEILKAYKTASCDDCHAFLSSRMQVPANELEDFCDLVVDAFYVPGSQDNSLFKSSLNSCLDLVQCPLKTRGTPTTSCQSLGFCDNQENYCKLSCNSGSCENYWIHTETKAECDTESTALGCGTCKDKGPSDAILTKAGMPTEGFVSLCAGGGSCVWSTQTIHCVGLKYYPALTTPEACKDACCGDDTCAVWQFDADGYSNQCWYGKKLGVTGGLTWTYGGIRELEKPYDEGTYQALDCVRPTSQCAGDYGSNDPCCGQGGTGLVDPQYQCPQSKPTCVNYVYNDHWGSCE